MKTRCGFYLRTPVDDGLIHVLPKADYRRIDVSGWEKDGYLHTEYPPAVGDLIYVYDGHYDDEDRGPGLCRVISRMWMHTAYGAANWPLGTAEPLFGPMCEFIVEVAEGQFADEAPPTEEDADD